MWKNVRVANSTCQALKKKKKKSNIGQKVQFYSIYKCLLLTGAGQHPLSLHDLSKLAWEIKKNNTLMTHVRRHKKQQILHAFTYIPFQPFLTSPPSFGFFIHPHLLILSPFSTWLCQVQHKGNVKSTICCCYYYYALASKKITLKKK